MIYTDLRALKKTVTTLKFILNDVFVVVSVYAIESF